jgi:orotidine-5'-phosphate decarboxylase
MKMKPHLFADELIMAVRSKRTPCIVGLDPTIERMPADFLRERSLTITSPREEQARALYEYCDEILIAVHDLVPAVKPQSAYFERFGAPGVAALEMTMARAKQLGLLVILDAKRGDIGPTAEAYALGYLGGAPLGVPHIDCMTLSPYLGADSLEPFFTVCERSGKGVFVCVKTSNAGAPALQDLEVDGLSIAEIVADFLRPWAQRLVGDHGYSGIGAVVGATYAHTAARLRSRLPHSLFLVPGIGAQGGEPHTLGQYFNPDGLGALISSSRAINFPHLYGGAQRGGREAIRAEALKFIASVRSAVPSTA